MPISYNVDCIDDEFHNEEAKKMKFNLTYGYLTFDKILGSQKQR